MGQNYKHIFYKYVQLLIFQYNIPAIINERNKVCEMLTDPWNEISCRRFSLRGARSQRNSMFLFRRLAPRILMHESPSR